MESIDLTCAEYGSRIAGDGSVEQSLVNSALAVLLEQGVYPMYLFLSSRGSNKEKNAAEKIRRELFKLLQKFFKMLQTSNHGKNNIDILQVIREKFQDRAEETFLAKDILEKALVYARYHLRAKN